jgi:hypothetical protein
MTEDTDSWSEADKIEWVLANGKPRIAWVYERIDQKVYRRPSRDVSQNIPPWFSEERELCPHDHFSGINYSFLIFDEFTDNVLGFSPNTY